MLSFVRIKLDLAIQPANQPIPCNTVLSSYNILLSTVNKAIHSAVFLPYMFEDSVSCFSTTPRSSGQ